MPFNATPPPSLPFIILPNGRKQYAKRPAPPVSLAVSAALKTARTAEATAVEQSTQAKLDAALATVDELRKALEDEQSRARAAEHAHASQLAAAASAAASAVESVKEGMEKAVKEAATAKAAAIAAKDKGAAAMAELQAVHPLTPGYEGYVRIHRIIHDISMSVNSAYLVPDLDLMKITSQWIYSGYRSRYSGYSYTRALRNLCPGAYAPFLIGWRSETVQIRQ